MNKKFYIFFLIFFLTSCDEYSANDINGVLQKYRNYPEIVKQVNDTIANAKDKTDKDYLKNFIKNGGTIEKYKTESENFLKEINKSCDSILGKDLLTLKEYNIIKNECDNGKNYYEKKVSDLKDFVNKCDFNNLDSNDFINDVLTLLNNGYDKDSGITLKNYTEIKQKYINETLLNENDYLIKNMKYNCLDNFLNNYNGISILDTIKNDLYYTKKLPENKTGSGTVIYNLRKNNNYRLGVLNFKKNIEAYYDDNISGSGGVKIAQILTNLDSCDQKCMNDYDNITIKSDELIES
ncbi:MAG: hypothetical protein PHE25_05080, partial [Candidatus Gracilibacteria bacterium]|nr:hypothetical protein [Candidatus Gracilibacteria bacterium]